MIKNKAFDRRKLAIGAALAAVALGCAPPSVPFAEPQDAAADTPAQDGVLTGRAAFASFDTEVPGTKRRITVADLPEPYESRSVDNGPRLVPRPEGVLPKVPAGFAVTEFAGGLHNPRQIAVAPNGDLFIAESRPGQIRVLRGMKDGRPEATEVYATGLRQPFGLAFYPSGANPKYLYVGNTDSVVRIPYKSGDLKARGAPEHVCDLPGGGRLRGGGTGRGT